MKYVVMNEHTLGYLIPEQPGTLGILHGSILRGSPHTSWDGWTSYNPGASIIRAATRQDFADYRVCVPPDFVDPEGSGVITDFDKAIERIRVKTDINDHTGAYVLGLQMLVGTDKWVAEMQRIASMHRTIGYLPEYLQEQRQKVYLIMLSMAKKQFTREQYETFYMSF